MSTESTLRVFHRVTVVLRFEQQLKKRKRVSGSPGFDGMKSFVGKAVVPTMLNQVLQPHCGQSIAQCRRRPTLDMANSSAYTPAALWHLLSLPRG